MAFMLIAGGCQPNSYENPPAFSPTPLDRKSNATAALLNAVPKTKRVPNPEYAVWKRFPVGTKVVRRNTLENENGVVSITTTLTLVNVTDSLLQVDSQTTVERPEDRVVNPPQTLDYYAQQSVLESTSDEQIDAPMRDAKLLGDEEVEVLGKRYKTKKYSWKTALETGPADVQGWFSDEIPGRQVLLRIDIGKSVGSEKIIQLDVPQM